MGVKSAKTPGNPEEKLEFWTSLTTLKFLHCVLPGVWIGPLQEKPGESYERTGIRTDQLTGYVKEHESENGDNGSYSSFQFFELFSNL